MPTWWITEAGVAEFTGGTDGWDLAAEAALRCSAFTPDEEDEQVADEPRSCYNCRYRRWQPHSIVCMRPRAGSPAEG
jgi:hypothetical protein